MSLSSINYAGYHAGDMALDPARPWQIILNPVKHHDIGIGVIIHQCATKLEAIKAILDAEALEFERKDGAT